MAKEKWPPASLITLNAATKLSLDLSFADRVRRDSFK